MRKNYIKSYIYIGLLIVAMYSIIYYTNYYNVKETKFNASEKMVVNYYFNGKLDKIIIKSEICEDNKQEILKELNKCKFRTRDSTKESKWNYYEEGYNYEIIYNNNLILRFHYEEEEMNHINITEIPITAYNEGEKFDAEIPIYVVLKIVNSVDEKLSDRMKIFQTEEITISAYDRFIKLNSIDRTKLISRMKKMAEIEQNLDGEKVEFIVDFNNGNKLQIYELRDKLQDNAYGTIIINGEEKMNVQIPFLMWHQIQSLYE